MKNRLNLNVPVDQFDILLPNGAPDPDNCLVTWQSANGEQKIFSGFTNGVSTYTGMRITQCQIVTNGNLPKASELEGILASSIAVAEHKIHAEWEKNAKDVTKMVDNTENVRPMHIHIHKEPELLEVLHNLGAKPRMLGPNPMQTARINLNDRLEIAGNAQKAKSRLVKSMSPPFSPVV